MRRVQALTLIWFDMVGNGNVSNWHQKGNKFHVRELGKSKMTME